MRALLPTWAGSGIDAIIMWAEFAVGFLLCYERFFSGYSGFPLSSKTNTSKFQFTLERKDTFKRVHMNSYIVCASWVNKQLTIFFKFEPASSQIRPYQREGLKVMTSKANGSDDNVTIIFPYSSFSLLFVAAC